MQAGTYIYKPKTVQNESLMLYIDDGCLKWQENGELMNSETCNL